MFSIAELELTMDNDCVEVSTEKLLIWGSRSSGRVETGLLESAADISSESMVLRNGATARGILGASLVLSLGGP